MSLSFPQDQRIAQVSLTRFVPQPMTGMHLQDQASVWPEQVTQSFCRRKKRKKKRKETLLKDAVDLPGLSLSS